MEKPEITPEQFAELDAVTADDMREAAENILHERGIGSKVKVDDVIGRLKPWYISGLDEGKFWDRVHAILNKKNGKLEKVPGVKGKWTLAEWQTVVENRGAGVDGSSRGGRRGR